MALPTSLQRRTDACVARYSISVRVAQPDPYAGLTGHDYIKARNLNRPVQRVQTSAQAQPGTAEVCS